MGFSIGFLGHDISHEDGAPFLLGAILLGTDEERFSAPLTYWQAEQYERHWANALARLMQGQTDSSFITSMYDPSFANFIVWWPMYRMAEQLVVQNQILFLDRLPGKFDENNPFQYVGPRQTVNQDGATISEWSVEFADVQEFCKRSRIDN